MLTKIETEIVNYIREKDDTVRPTEVIHKKSDFTSRELRSSIWDLVEGHVIDFDENFRLYICF